MNIPMYPDKENHIWKLFGKIVKIIDSRTFQQELARNNLVTIERYQIMLKLVILSCFF